MSRLPDVLAALSPIGGVLAAVEAELRNFSDAVEQKNAQLSVSTAMDGLALMEDDYGLMQGGDIAARRGQLYAKLQGTGSTTAEMVSRIVAGFVEGAVIVTETFAENRVNICFVASIGVPDNLAELTRTLRERLPSHVEWTYQYRYRTHGELAAYSHAALAAYTHQELKEEDLT